MNVGQERNGAIPFRESDTGDYKGKGKEFVIIANALISFILYFVLQEVRYSGLPGFSHLPAAYYFFMLPS
jgi:hypothetical protein